MSVEPDSGAGDSLADKIEKADEWDEKMTILCQHHDLPDARSRRGLKQIHKSFDLVSKQLDATYRSYEENEDVQNALIVLYGLICQDYVLEDRLVADGLLQKTVSFVQREDVRALAMAILLRMIRHHGPPRWEIIRQIYPALARVMTASLNERDDATVKALLHVLSCAAQVVVHYNTRFTDRIPLDLPEILTFHTTAFHHLGSSHRDIVVNFNFLVKEVIREKSSAPLLFEQKPALNLLVAGLARSCEFTERLVSLSLFVSLHQHKVKGSLAPGFNIPRACDVLQGELLSTEKANLLAYGLERTETYRAYQARTKFVDATTAHYCIGLDLVTCGWNIFHSIMEYAPAVFSCTVQGEFRELIRLQIFLDILPRCAHALRDAGPSKPENVDAADILDSWYHREMGETEALSAIAKRAITRSPQQGFFYYVAATACADKEKAMGLAKQGLTNCTHSSTPWHVRLALHQIVAKRAFDLVMSSIRKFMTSKVPPTNFTGHDALALMVEIQLNCSAYLHLAPPDSRGRKEMIGVLFLSLVAFFGRPADARMGDELKELQESFQAAGRLLGFLDGGCDPYVSLMELTFKTFLDNYEAAYSEWEAIVANCTYREGADEYPSSGAPGSTLYILSSLPEKVQKEVWDMTGHTDTTKAPKVPPQTLFRCAYCHNPSAALRKCARCLRVAYCSVDCQKKHWKAGRGDEERHKEKCILVSSNTS